MSPTISHWNIHQVEEIVRMALEEGATEIRLNPFCATGRGANTDFDLSEQESMQLRECFSKMQILYDKSIIIDAPEGVDINKPERKACYTNSGLPDMMGCGAGRTSLAISPIGEVLHCILYRKVVGDLRKSSFHDIWEFSPYLINQRAYKENCKGCIHQPLCSGLCPLVEKNNNENKKEFIEDTNHCSINLKRSQNYDYNL